MGQLKEKTVRGATTEITCLCGCDRTRLVRTADVERGWGKYYNKQCKAKYQYERQLLWGALADKKVRKFFPKRKK